MERIGGEHLTPQKFSPFTLMSRKEEKKRKQQDQPYNSSNITHSQWKQKERDLIKSIFVQDKTVKVIQRNNKT
jgi:hypothetical protein